MQQQLRIDWLDNILVDTQVDRFEKRFRFVERRGDNNRHRRILPLDQFSHFQPAHHRHHDVRYHHLRPMLAPQLKSLLAVRRDVQLPHPPPEKFRQMPADIGIILDIKHRNVFHQVDVISSWRGYRSLFYPGSLMLRHIIH